MAKLWRFENRRIRPRSARFRALRTGPAGSANPGFPDGAGSWAELLRWIFARQPEESARIYLAPF